MLLDQSFLSNNMEDRVRIIDLPKILDKRGNLSIIEELRHIPFKIARTYWIYDVPGGERRGGHAYFSTNSLALVLASTPYDAEDYIYDYQEFLRIMNP